MASNETRQNTSVNLSGYLTALTDVARHWLFIVSVSLGIGLMVWVRMNAVYQPVYTSTTVMTVSQSGMDRSTFSDSTSASSAADKFSAILNSTILRKKVAEQLGMDAFSGTTQASVVKNTNILNISVSASTPQIAFHEMKGVLENYDVVSSKLMGNLNLTVLQEPNIPARPGNSPNGLLRGLEAGAVTAAVLFCVFLLVSLTRDTIRTEADVRHKLKVRLLVTLMHEKRPGLPHKDLLEGQRPLLITDNTAGFYYVETIHRMARRIRDILDERQAHSLLISSVREHEGKSTVSVNLALALAQEKKKVLLIDGDLRKPDLYQILGVKEEEIHDFSEVLEQQRQGKDAKILWEPYIIRHGVIYCLLNTHPEPAAAEAAASGRFADMIAQLSEQMDYIIVDSSPVALTADSEEMVNAVDATAIVVHQHLVEARTINDTIDILQGGAKRKFIGCIFNDVRYQQTANSYGHHGYYHGYSHYGYGSRYGYGNDGQRRYDRYERYSRYGRNGDRGEK